LNFIANPSFGFKIMMKSSSNNNKKEYNKNNNSYEYSIFFI